MVKYGFFNAVKNHDGSYDRGYNSEDINKYFEGAMSENGIYKFVGNQCTVNAYNGMNVLVKDGKGAIKFHWFKLDTDEAVAITPSHPTLSRYTAIVARYDNSNRQIYLGTIDGEYEEIPSKPELIRSDSIYDLCLAYVYVEAGATEITSENIQDTRGNEELCGFIKTLLDNGSGGGIPQVDHLPLPQASEIGKLYYLTVKDGDNEPGFYTCKRLTIYGYKDVNMLSGVIADRPDPQFEFANQVYYATDELKYYVCKKNDEGIYEWNEIEVTETSGLPTASVDTLNNYYLDTTDNTLHLGISEIGYGYAPFNGGGGNFAIIQISCPPGTNVRVSHNGEHQTKEVSDGIWLYGCIDAGEYVVAIPNTSTSQIVTITDKGQVESVYVSEQVVNYEILFLLGDENINLTGGWQRKIALDSNTLVNKTNNPIILNSGERIFALTNFYNESGTGSWSGNSAVGMELIGSDLNIKYINYNAQRGTSLIIGNINNQKVDILYTKTYINGYGDWQVWGLGGMLGGHKYYERVYSAINVYFFIIIVKTTDDISGLSAYGLTINDILNNSINLFNDRTALDYMVHNCTGDFMLSAVSNSTFKSVYTISKNKDILLANEHWAKFIPVMNYI